MKKSFLVIITFTLLSCNGYIEKQILKYKCKKYLLNQLDDISEFEVVEWGKIDTISKSDPYKYRKYIDYASNLNYAIFLQKGDASSPSDSGNNLFGQEMEVLYRDSINIYLTEFRNNKFGYTIPLSFRSKLNSNIKLQNVIFQFDSLNNIVKMVNADELVL